MHAKRQIRTTALWLAISLAFIVGMVTSFPVANPGLENTFQIHGMPCVCKNVAEDGICNANTPQAYCKHNTLTNGAEIIEDYLSTSAGGTFTYLALSNDSTDFPTAGDTNFTTELSGGLARAEATLYDMGTGNWSLVKTWTADGTFKNVNTTGIFNNSAPGLIAYLAGGTFSSVDLESGDTLTINYTLWVS